MITDKNQIKALTLMIASEISDASSDELISCVLATDLVSITDMTDAFEELINDGLLELSKGMGENMLCSITAKGKSILTELETLLPSGISEQAKRSAVRFHKGNVCGEEFLSEIKSDDNGYVLICSHLKNKAEMCRVVLCFETEKEAVLARNNFELRPETVISNIRAAVTGKIEYLF